MFAYVSDSNGIVSRRYETPTTSDLVKLWILKNPRLADCGFGAFEDAETRNRWESLDDCDKRDVYAIYDASAGTIQEALDVFDNGGYHIWWNVYADRPDDYRALGEVIAEETGVLNDVPEMYCWYFDFVKYGRDVVFSGDFNWSGRYRVFVELC